MDASIEQKKYDVNIEETKRQQELKETNEAIKVLFNQLEQQQAAR